MRTAERVAKEFLQFLSGPLKKQSKGKFACGREAFEFRLRHYHHYDLKPAALKKIGEQAEKYRHDLAIEWLGQPMTNWAKPCPIVAAC